MRCFAVKLFRFVNCRRRRLSSRNWWTKARYFLFLSSCFRPVSGRLGQRNRTGGKLHSETKGFKENSDGRTEYTNSRLFTEVMVACRLHSTATIFSLSVILSWVHTFCESFGDLIGFLKGFPVDPSAVFGHLLVPSAFFFFFLPYCMISPFLYSLSVNVFFLWKGDLGVGKSHSYLLPLQCTRGDSRGVTAILLLPVFACEMCCFINKQSSSLWLSSQILSIFHLTPDPRYSSWSRTWRYLVDGDSEHRDEVAIWELEQLNPICLLFLSPFSCSFAYIVFGQHGKHREY